MGCRFLVGAVGIETARRAIRFERDGLGRPAIVLESKRIESDGAGWCYDHVAAAAVGEAGVVIGEAVAGGERGVAVVGGAIRQNATLEAHGAAGVIDGATGGADAGVCLVARKRAVGDSQRAVVTDGAAKAEAEAPVAWLAENVLLVTVSVPLL